MDAEIVLQCAGKKCCPIARMRVDSARGRSFEIRDDDGDVIVLTDEQVHTLERFAASFRKST